MSKTKTPVDSYVKALERELKQGNATEHTHRRALQDFIEAIGGKGVLATNEPKRVSCGAPDLIITKNGIPIGHIECKDLGVDLDKTETSDQMKRYLGSLDNLILTDYVEFRWYVMGQLRTAGRIGDLKQGRIQPLAGADEGLAVLLTLFLTDQTPTVRNPQELAQRMAGLGKLMREAINKAFENEGTAGPLHDQLAGFRDILLHDMDKAQFADMYAQTLCYGLFAARCNHPVGEAFTRTNAARELPKTNPFLQKLFGMLDMEMNTGDLPFVWAVEDLAQLLNRSRMEEILADFGKSTRQEDPVVHFYETFLGEYDKALKDKRGVFYTPEPVVSYIVRSVDEILQTQFGLKGGMANKDKISLALTPEVKSKSTAKETHVDFHKVQILDPATGTGTFLYSVIQQIYSTVGAKNAGMWSGYVRDHLLPRLHGFELLMAPYSVAHLKLSLLLKETGYDFNDNERLRVYLTNTLEEAVPMAGLPLFSSFLANEANQASHVKTQVPVMVVLGNPPYSGHSANNSEWIKKLMHGDTEDATKGHLPSYFKVDGHGLGERNPKWLNDDYVKFIRFGQWRIEANGEGVLAFISNHGYLDNPTFRGMRQSLMHTFDEIYVLDLHGNAKKKETCPDGSPDKNVFDIQQGVAIGIFIKRSPTTPTKAPAKIYHADLWGPRETTNEAQELTGGKYHWLANNSISTTPWQQLDPAADKYLFIPQNNDDLAEYQYGWAVNDIFPTNSVGIVTARDALTIHFDKSTCEDVVNNFASMPTEQARDVFELGKDARDWWVEWAQQDLNSSELSPQNYRPILYRPFDTRWTYYTGKTKGFHCMPRNEVMQHFLTGPNLGLLIGRSGNAIGENEWDICSIAKNIVEFNYFRRGGNVAFPLYTYPKPNSANLLDALSSQNIGGRQANLAPTFISAITKTVGLTWLPDGHGDLTATFGPEDVFHYMYAVLHSPTYRSRYAQFLKQDFPRIPLPSSLALFQALVPLGQQLAAYHLMTIQGTHQPTYPVDGAHTVERPSYQEPDGSYNGRVYINATQYFDGIAPDVWAFHVGGYQVCHKWLKDRKGRTLTYDDIQHYQHTVAALTETIRLMAEVDATIEANGGWPIQPSP